MSRSAKRKLLFAVLSVFLVLQGWAALVQHGGGIAAKYTFVEGFTEYFRMSLADPLLTAGLIDFMTVAGIAVVSMIALLPRERRWAPRTFVWLVAFTIFPGLGVLLYLLWLNPDNPVMRDSA